MKELLQSRATIIWFILVTATCASWAMGHGVGFSDARQASVFILVIAFVKARFVILDFMEIRHAPRLLRIVGEVWIVVVCAILVTQYLRAPH